MMQRRPTLYRRLLLIQLLLVSMAWLAFGVASWLSLVAGEQTAVDGDLKLISQTLAAMASVGTTAQQRQEIVARLGAINLQASEPPLATHEAGYQLWTSKGQLLLRWPANSPMPALHPGSAGQPLRRAVDGWQLHGQFSADGEVFAVAGYSSGAIARLHQLILVQILAGLFLLWVLVGLALWLAARLGLRPLNRLAERLRQRPDDDLSPLAAPGQHAELQPLVAAIDARSQTLAQQLAREREFFADAAHELRTPLAALEAQAHVLAGAADAQARVRALQELEQGVQRCARSLDMLLAQARLDAQTGPLQLGDCDLAQLCREALARQAPRALEKGLQLAYLGRDQLPVRADADLLATALDCLLDNALRHAEGVRCLSLDADADALGWRLEAVDDGAGIGAADAQQLFERFARGSSAAPGSGLGLAVVRRVATLHGGRAAFMPRARGCCVRLGVGAWAP